MVLSPLSWIWGNCVCQGVFVWLNEAIHRGFSVKTHIKQSFCLASVVDASIYSIYTVRTKNTNSHIWFSYFYTWAYWRKKAIYIALLPWWQQTRFADFFFSRFSSVQFWVCAGKRSVQVVNYSAGSGTSWPITTTIQTHIIRRDIRIGNINNIKTRKKYSGRSK